MTTAQVPYVIGTPGMRSALTAEHRRPLTSTAPMFLPGGRFIDGTKARDPGNTPYVEALRAGLIMGKRSANNYFANSVIGSTTGALAAGGTSITISAASAVELVRRVGASGNLTLTGPPAAGGTARQVATAYSAVNTGTGVVTITAPANANQVDQIAFNVASTAGNLQLTIQKPDGTFATTANAAWNATDATYLAAINTQLDASSGVVGGIVASAIPGVDPDLGIRLTYSGGAYAGQTWTKAIVATFPTSSTIANYARITEPTNGAFIAGSWVGDTDGSQVPELILPDGCPIPTTDLLNTGGLSPLQFPQIPIAALVDTTLVVDWPADAGFITWLRGKLCFDGGPKLIFPSVI